MMVPVTDQNHTKPWYTSKTIWGLILMAVGEVLEKEGVAYTEYLKIIGLILAAIGRILANAKLTLY